MDDGSLHYTSVNHPYHLMTAINHLRQKQVLCDILLKVGDHQIPVHKLMLSVCSPYFKNLGDSKPETSNLSELHLTGLDGEAVQQLVEFFYTSAISVTEATVWGLLPAASTLQVDEVQNLCCDYLSSHIQLENCLTIHKLAAKHLCSALLKETTDYIKSNFEKILEEECFLDMTVENMLTDLKRLSDTGLSEDRVLQGIKCWLIYCLEERQSFGPKIIKVFSNLKEKLQEFIPEEYLAEIEDEIPEKESETEDESSDEMSFENQNILYKFSNKLKTALADENVDLEDNISVDVVRHQVQEIYRTFYGWNLENIQSMQNMSENLNENADILNQSENTNHDESFERKENSSSDMQYLCTWPECDRGFASRTGLRYHMNAHKNQYPYFCEQCNKGFNRISQYESHCNKHLGTAWECPICGAKVRTQQGRKVHESQHKKQTYTCDICEKTFNCKEYMQAHRRSHVNTFECQICKKKFKRKHHLVEHVKVHEKNGFRCEHCNFVTNYRQSLRRHMQGVHTPNSSNQNTTKGTNIDSKKD